MPNMGTGQLQVERLLDHEFRGVVRAKVHVDLQAIDDNLAGVAELQESLHLYVTPQCTPAYKAAYARNITRNPYCRDGQQLPPDQLL